MYRLQHTVFLAIDEGALFLSILAPEQKYQPSCLGVQPAYNSISQLLPTLDQHPQDGNDYKACGYTMRLACY